MTRDALGVFFGPRPDHRREHLVRAMAEGIRHHLLLIMGVFADLGMTSSEVVALGGLAESSALVSLLASATGKLHCVALSASHATCRGAAMLRAVGLGLLASLSESVHWTGYEPPTAPDPAGARHIEADYEAFRELYGVLVPLFRLRALERGRAASHFASSGSAPWPPEVVRGRPLTSTSASKRNVRVRPYTGRQVRLPTAFAARLLHPNYDLND